MASDLLGDIFEGAVPRLSPFSSHEPSWQPEDAFAPRGGARYPHVMLTMWHGLEDEERLLTGEVMTIVAAMKTHLGFPQTESHVVAPVEPPFLYVVCFAPY